MNSYGTQESSNCWRKMPANILKCQVELLDEVNRFKSSVIQIRTNNYGPGRPKKYGSRTLLYSMNNT
jgi:hypothetical protein